MRVSSSQFFHTTSAKIMAKQSQVNKTLAHMASGKRLHTAADDPLGAGQIDAFRKEIKSFEQYQQNITLARNRLSAEESTLASVENVVLAAKDKVLLGVNGSMSQENRSAVAAELQAQFDSLLNLANSRDEQGNYIFSGYSNDKQAFVFDTQGRVNYQGDNGQRLAQVSPVAQTKTNDGGDRLFMQVPNPAGDFYPDYQVNNGEIQIRGAHITNLPASHDPATQPPPYQVSFQDDGNGGLEAVIADSASPPNTTTQPYTPGGAISFNGVEIQLDGDPQDGDRFELTASDERDLFSTIQDAITFLEKPFTPETEAQYQQLIDDMDSAFNHLTSARAEVGMRLKSLDDQEELNGDHILSTQGSLSAIEDLDYAEAAVTLQEQMIALQATQQSFAKITQLNLFNFI